MPEALTNTLPLPVRAIAAAQPAPEKRGVDDMFESVMTNVERTNKLLSAVTVNKAMAGAASEAQQPPQGTATTAFKEMAEAAKSLGIDYGTILSDQRATTEALRNAVTQADREKHQAELDLVTEKLDRVREKADEMRAAQQPQDIGVTLGLGPLTDENRSIMQRRMLNIPAEGKDGAVAAPASPLDPLKNAVGGLKELVSGLVELGLVQKPGQAPAAPAAGGVTMVDLAALANGGKVPVDLLLPVLKIQSEERLATMRADRELKIEERRVGAMENLTRTLQENVPAAIQAWNDTLGSHREDGAPEATRELESPEQPERRVIPPPSGQAAGAPPVRALKCSDCLKEFVVLEEPEVFHYHCPHCGVDLHLPGHEPTAPPQAAQVPAEASPSPTQPVARIG